MTLAHNVSELLKSAMGASRQVTIDEPKPRFAHELHLVRPLEGKARLLRTPNGILVRAHMATSVELECSRCLEPVELDLAIDLDEEFRPSVNVLTGAPLAPPEDEALRIDERHVLDLTEAARQYLSTALPLQALCTATCRGLCPVCGMNLNQESCTCAPEPLAPAGPFAALAQLVDSDENQEVQSKAS